MEQYLASLVVFILNIFLLLVFFKFKKNILLFRITLFNTFIQAAFSYVFVKAFYVSDIEIFYVSVGLSQLLCIFLPYLFLRNILSDTTDDDSLEDASGEDRESSSALSINESFIGSLKEKLSDYQRLHNDTHENIEDLFIKLKSVITLMRKLISIDKIELMDIETEAESEATSPASIIGKTIGIITYLDTCVEKTIHEMKKQSETLQITFDAFDMNNISMEKVDQFTKEARNLANRLEEMAGKGGDIINVAATSMAEINKASESMSGIVDTINDISEKTNLLSMNAAIEAARAGQHGRGFSVVAQEVRKLASNTRKSTEEINTIIQVTRSKILDGVAMVNKTGAVFKEIVVVIEEINSINEDIYTISKRNLIQGKEILTAVNMLKEVADNIISSSNEELFTTNQVVGAIEEIELFVKKIVTNLNLAVSKATELKKSTQSIPTGVTPL
jgi:methyl-accepting chemotaxis protein